MPATRVAADAHVDAIRAFNRFYTARIGILREGHLGTPHSLAEVRILYEIARRKLTTAADLCRELDIDPGYASRLLRRLEKAGLLSRKPDRTDARRSAVRLTPKGKRRFADLDRRARDQVATLLEPIPLGDRTRVVQAMRTIRDAMSPGAEPGPIVFRDPQPGDLGWVAHRHGALYSLEYGWDERFEALVARVVADYVADRDPARERCWIAERDGEILGSVFLVRHSQTVGKLRLLLVEPWARGIGLGSRLVDEAIAFARHAGYRKLILWTNDVLVDARRIYERRGFRLTKEEPHRMFGPPLVAQTWELRLGRTEVHSSAR